MVTLTGEHELSGSRAVGSGAAAPAAGARGAPAGPSAVGRSGWLPARAQRLCGRRRISYAVK